MNELMTRLGKDHRNLTRLLSLFDDILDRFDGGEEPDYDIMEDMLAYMESYADRIHHPAEDLIFKRLMEHSGDGRQLLELLIQQHKTLGEMNKRFRDTLDGIVHGEVIPRDQLSRQGREYCALLRTHMLREDNEAFELARAHLAEDDWKELLAAAPDCNDPLFEHPDPERFNALFRYLSEHGEP